MPGDVVELRAVAGREVRVRCGCAVVECAPRMIDDGRFLIGRAHVIVPCNDGHRDAVCEVAQSAGTADLDEIARLLEGALA